MLYWGHNTVPARAGEETAVIKWFKKLPNTTKMMLTSGLVALLAVGLVLLTVLQNG